MLVSDMVAYGTFVCYMVWCCGFGGVAYVDVL